VRGLTRSGRVGWVAPGVSGGGGGVRLGRGAGRGGAVLPTHVIDRLLRQGACDALVSWVERPVPVSAQVRQRTIGE
jgi:hypothetical protein